MTSASIAKPYAKAVFQVASSDNQVDRWLMLLEASATLSDNKDLINFMSSPTQSLENKSILFTNLILEILPSSPNTKEMNYVKLLIDNHRMLLSPYIYIEFQNIVNANNNTKYFDVCSAYTLSQKEKSDITSILSQGKDYTVKINVSIDNSLLGGVVVRDGDAIIDVSIREMANKLASHLLIN